MFKSVLVSKTKYLRESLGCDQSKAQQWNNNGSKDESVAFVFLLSVGFFALVFFFFVCVCVWWMVKVTVICNGFGKDRHIIHCSCFQNKVCWVVLDSHETQTLFCMVRLPCLSYSCIPFSSLCRLSSSLHYIRYYTSYVNTLFLPRGKHNTVSSSGSAGLLHTLPWDWAYSHISIKPWLTDYGEKLELLIWIYFSSFIK